MQLQARITHPRQQPETAEDGYLLLAVLVLVALLLISLAVAAPKVALDLQRDKETEAMHRGMQYARAIRLYYRKFGSYPSSVDQLENTNQIRFIRKRYVDPITGKDDWKLIHMGEAKVAPQGLFGQALQPGLSSASTGINGNGTSVAGGIGQANTPVSGSPDGSASSNPGTLVSSGMGTSGGSPFGSGSGANGFGGNAGASGIGSSPFNSSSGAGSPGASSSPFSSGPTGAGNGDPGNGGTSPGAATGALGGTPGIGGTAPGGTAGGNGTFGGGGPIVGVSIPLKKASIRIFKKQQHYDEWEFVYDPMQDQGGLNGQTGTGVVQGAGSNPIASPGQTPGQADGSNPSGFGGSGLGGSGFGGSGSGGSGLNGSGGAGLNGGSGGFGSSPTSPTAPPTSGSPQQ